MSMVQVIGLCGAGSVGKTTLINAFMEDNNKEGIFDIEFFPSVVRGFYKEQGIDTEISLRDKPNDYRLWFQESLFEYYNSQLDKAIIDAEKRGIDYIITDRTHIDHFAYWVNSQDTFFQGDYESMKHKVFMCMECFDGVVLFPFPPPFEVGYDSFRTTDTKQHVVVNAFMRDTAYQVEDFYSTNLPLLDFSLIGAISSEDRQERLKRQNNNILDSRLQLLKEFVFDNI